MGEKLSVVRTEGDDGQASGGTNWSILEKYAQDERRRVDEVKDELYQMGYHILEKLNSPEDLEKIKQPSQLRKFGRAVMDAVNLHPYNSERQREKEAYVVARQEYDAERAEKRFHDEMKDLQGQRAGDVKDILEAEIREHREQKERDALAEKIEEERGISNRRYQTERIQELAERDLNQRLTRVSDIEELAEAGDPEVEKRSLEYEGEEIPVYDLKGVHFTILSHAIDYRANHFDKNGEYMGARTAKRLVEDPELWKRNRDDVEMERNGGDAQGSVISVSYINSDTNLNTRVYDNRNDGVPNTCYGFDHVGGDTVLMTYIGDAGSGNQVEGVDDSALKGDVWGKMELLSQGTHNEVVMRRYDETGRPIMPSCIIAQNNKISEDMLRHAKAFNIPILNIDEKSYNKKFEQKAREILDGVQEGDDYEKIVRALHQIGSISSYRHVVPFAIEKSLDDKTELRRSRAGGETYPYGVEHEIVELANIELQKRVPFLEETLRHEIQEIRAATEHEEYYDAKKNVEGCTYFDVTEFDREQWVPGDNGEDVKCTFCLEGDKFDVAIEIHEKDGHDGEIYHRIAPLVHEYLEVREENRRQDFLRRRAEH